MFCIHCGQELEEGMAYCPSCGTVIGNVSPQNKPQIGKSKKNNAIFLGAITVPFILFIGGIILIISLWNKSDISEKREKSDTAKVKEEKKEKKYTEGKINSKGNDYANLSFSAGAKPGRVTGQDDKIYFYEQGVIYEMDATGNKKQICPASSAYSLNIIGNTLYFLEDSTICAVQTDSGEKQEVLGNVLAPFIVYKDYIYYVTSSNVTATNLDYYICKYNLNKKEPQESFCTESNFPTLVGINERMGDAIIFYCKKEPYTEEVDGGFMRYYVYYFHYAVEMYDFNTNERKQCDFKAPAFCGQIHDHESINVIMVADEVYVIQRVGHTTDYGGYGSSVEFIRLSDFTTEDKSAYSQSVHYYNPRNSYKDRLLIEAGRNASGLYSITPRDMCDLVDSGGMTVNADLIVDENENYLYEVYVVGDCVYYTLETTYDSAVLYKINIDGTGWQEL